MTMRKSPIISIAIALLSIFSFIKQVLADGYEVETVGGVLEPTNFVMTLLWSVLIGIGVLGVFIALGLIRIEKVSEEE